MRDSKRIERILVKLEQLWLAYPDQRLGQLIVNLTPVGFEEPFYVEDDSLEKQIDRVLKDGWFGNKRKD